MSPLPPPEHVAIIMDGNSRWARERFLPRVMGHKAGIESIRRVAEAADRRGIRVLTVYAFSTENWSRPRDEVDALMTLFSESIRREVDELARRKIELRFSGRLHELSITLQEQIVHANERTRIGARAVLNIAINYGGRGEIIDAIRELAAQGTDLTSLDERAVSEHLYTRGLPDPDLVIRTAGEMRLSNFLLWQAAYSEFYSTATLWPDFGEDDLDEALASYQRRVRRFGSRPEEVTNRGRKG
ncbi:MAG: polyprenyl diphosphate synthase [Candidatus Dormibacter sp.]